ncbi:MAG: bifunctional folylpolyglutamate synthase/dihydrofolate synthase [bacterium JZ-2024 1]
MNPTIPIQESDEIVREILSVCPEKRMEPGLGNIIKTLNWLGHPQKNFRNILIVGTKGKGSMAVFCASYLFALGYKTGLFTSPHLQDITERIIVNGQRIPLSVLAENFRRFRSLWEKGILPKLTFFELLHAIAVKWFTEQQVEFAVWEAGMGGRLDSTNALHKDLILVGLIGMDHTEWLGSTHRRIYQEKTAVITDSLIPVVFSRQKPFVRKWIQQDFPGASLLGKDFSWLPLDENEWEYSGKERKKLRLKMPGWFQRDNASTVLRAMEQMWGKLEENAVSALSRAFFPGRMEYVRAHPPVILDGAHNTDSIRILVKELKRAHGREKWIFLVGIQATKPAERMIPLLEEIAEEFVFTDVPGALHPRPKEDLSVYTRRPHRLLPFPDALPWCLQSGKPLCITGSLYLVGASRKALHLPIPPFFGS